MALITYEDYIAHFGVKGMRWGVRNEKEVSSEVQAKRDAKAKKYTDRAAEYQKQIDALNQSGKKRKIRKAKGIEKDRDRALKDAELKRQGKLSTTQKKVAIGAAVVGTLITAQVASNYVQSGEFRRLSEKGKAAVTGTPFQFKKNDLLSKQGMSSDEVFDRVVKQVNPDYGAVGTNMNCRRCTFAYELRRRGFDVSATRTTKGNGQSATGLYDAIHPGSRNTGTGGLTTFIRWARSGKIDQMTKLNDIVAGGGAIKIEIKEDRGSNFESIFSALSHQPNGSRGELGVNWTVGGGHSLAYEVFDGKPVIFDTQLGKRYSSVGEMLAHNYPYISGAGFTRLDNIELNTDFLMRWVKNAE